ncbi:DUF4174 domain-containing protein [Runella sp.]|uniref:DUF4174 domain-containing protein n=1 Tax=Runella sp. TaxID=1960881 RepID=UPI002614259F|nr:DUF4174 domain-containing protein [Runella sp.]
MHLVSIVICSLFLFFQDPLENKLGSMVGKSRVVILYCPKVSDAEFKLQKKWLSEVGKGILERDLSIIDCIESDLTTDDALHLKERFKYTPNHFCFWLIGKDGEIKLISNKPVKPEQLFGLIDSMPMRREEMKKN